MGTRRFIQTGSADFCGSLQMFSYTACEPVGVHLICRWCLNSETLLLADFESYIFSSGSICFFALGAEGAQIWGCSAGC